MNPARWKDQVESMKGSRGVMAFATILGVPYTTVSNWLTGKSVPPEWQRRIFIPAFQARLGLADDHPELTFGPPARASRKKAP